MSRYLARLLAFLLVATSLLFIVFIADAERQRHGDFIERRGAVVSVLEESRAGPSSRGITLASETGLSVRIRVLLPDDHDGPLRTLIVLGGYRTGSRAVELAGDLANIAIVALDYPYDGTLKFDDTWTLLKALPGIRRALLDTPPSISLTLSWLEGQAWADQQQLELVGVSFGVPFAATAAALDQRIDGLWLVHGAADNYVWLKANVQRWVKGPWVKALLARLLYWVVYAPSFDTAQRVKAVAPRQVTIIGAREDERTPKAETEALFAAAAEPKRLFWTDGKHVEPRRQDIVRALLSLLQEES